MTNIKRRSIAQEPVPETSSVLDDPRWKSLVFGEASPKEIAELRAWGQHSEEARAAWTAFQPISEQSIDDFTTNVTLKVRMYRAWKTSIPQALVSDPNIGIMLVAPTSADHFVANPRGRQLIAHYAPRARVVQDQDMERNFSMRAVFETRINPVWQIPDLQKNATLDVHVQLLKQSAEPKSGDWWLIVLREHIESLPMTQVVARNSLTKREREIAWLLVQHGLSAMEIAAQLRISVATVRKHIENVHKKLKVHSTTELVALFRKPVQT